MLCKNTLGNDKCGKCKYDIMSNDFVRNKSLFTIAKIAAKISWLQEFNDDNGTLNSYMLLRISCNDLVSINTPSTNENFSIKVVKTLCNKLFNNWYKCYPLSKKLDSYQYIKDKLELADKTSSINKIRTILLSITKHIEMVTTCNGNCTTVVPGKEVGNCRFDLSDINKIVKFNSNGIVDLFNTILYTIKDVATINLTINLNSTYVTCAGNIVMDNNFVMCKSTLNDMKSIYVYYLSAWCSTNICKESEVKKIRANIDSVKRARYISQIYELSLDLLEII